jgi:molecular chaperone DnaJ
MAQRDYYEVLEVSREATPEEIKAAYRKKAMHLHPDRLHASKEKKSQEQLKAEFTELQHAYDVLSDPEKRSKYDTGRLDEQGGWAGGAPHFDFEEAFGEFGDLFGNIFSGRRNARASYASQGSDLRYTLSLNLEDVVFGCNPSIQVARLGRCRFCEGTGSRDKSKPVVCATCKGKGQVYMHRGPFSIQQTCSDCRGQGRYNATPCTSCRGSGQAQETRNLSVKIPAGISEGDQIRLAGEGEVGVQGGAPGDLYVQVHINPHPLFARQANDLRGEMPVSYITATLGGDVEVPTITGRVKVNIPRGTPNGKVFKLKGKGIPKVHGHGAGDLFLTLMVEVPTHLNKDQIELLKAFEVSLQNSSTLHYPSIKKWIDTIKNFFTPKEKNQS